jgi:hypothetical protein
VVLILFQQLTNLASEVYRRGRRSDTGGQKGQHFSLSPGGRSMAFCVSGAMQKQHSNTKSRPALRLPRMRRVGAGPACEHSVRTIAPDLATHRRIISNSPDLEHDLLTIRLRPHGHVGPHCKQRRV